MTTATWQIEDDPDDPMTVTEIPCAICGASVNPDGTCTNGHDDLDRADAASSVRTPEESAYQAAQIAAGFGDPYAAAAAEALADVIRGLDEHGIHIDTADQYTMTGLATAAGLTPVCVGCGDPIHPAGQPCPAATT
jgi:hypothetical protein